MRNLDPAPLRNASPFGKPIKRRWTVKPLGHGLLVDPLTKGSSSWVEESHRRSATLAASELVRKGAARKLEKANLAIWRQRTSPNLQAEFIPPPRAREKAMMPRVNACQSGSNGRRATPGRNPAFPSKLGKPRVTGQTGPSIPANRLSQRKRFLSVEHPIQPIIIAKHGTQQGPNPARERTTWSTGCIER